MLSRTGEIAEVLAEGDASDLWPWLLIAGGGLLLLVFFRLFAKRGRTLDEPKRARTAQEELRHSMDRLLVELQETAREINATIDTKMIALNKLIEDADRRIKTLEDRHAADEPGGPPPAAQEEEPTGEEALKRRQLEREICRLADEGKTELEIARITDTPRGEVELVLSLRRMPDGHTSRGDGTAS